MGMKGFYFSLDASVGLSLIAMASSIIMATAFTSLTNQDVQFSQYSSQSNDVANNLMNQEASNLDIEFERPEMKRENVARLVVREEEMMNGMEEEILEEFLQDYRFETSIYIDRGQGLEPVNGETDFRSSASSEMIVAGEEDPVRMAVVVGE